MKWKSVFAAGLAVLLTAGSAAGCAPEQTNETLTVWVFDPDYQKAFSYAAMKFRERYPDVELEFAQGPVPVDSGDEAAYRQYQSDLAIYQEKMRTEVMGHSGPDLILFNDATFPNLYKTMDSGVFAPLDPFIEGDETYQCGSTGAKEPFQQAILDGGVYRGKRYFMPLYYWMPGVLTTTENLNRFGLSRGDLDSHAKLIEALAMIAEADPEGWLCDSSAEELAAYVELDGFLEMDYAERTISLDPSRAEAMAEKYGIIRRHQSRTSPGAAHELIRLRNGDTFMRTGNLYALFNRSVIVHAQAEPQILPLRHEDGTPAAVLNVGAAVNAYSPNQQNAYEFLKICMYADAALSDRYMYDLGFPVNENGFHKKMLNLIRFNENYVNLPGNLDGKPVAPEYFDQAEEWEKEITVLSIDTGLGGEYWKWMNPYFRGEQSFDSCYQTMESALEIMISE